MTSKKKRTPQAAGAPTTKSRRTKAVQADAAAITEPPPSEPDRGEATALPPVLHPDVAVNESVSASESEAPAPTVAPVETATATLAAESMSPANKLSALDAAAKVLAETGQAMSCGELIAAMAAKGYWQSPRGRTPAGTLYSGILRELQTKGAKARFSKCERGKFRFNTAR
jgi:hypothetical protein